MEIIAPLMFHVQDERAPFRRLRRTKPLLRLAGDRLEKIMPNKPGMPQEDSDVAFDAVSHGKLNTLQAMVAQGRLAKRHIRALDVVDDDGYTLLSKAQASGHRHILEFLEDICCSAGDAARAARRRRSAMPRVSMDMHRGSMASSFSGRHSGTAASLAVANYYATRGSKASLERLSVDESLVEGNEDDAENDSDASSVDVIFLLAYPSMPSAIKVDGAVQMLPNLLRQDGDGPAKPVRGDSNHLDDFEVVPRLPRGLMLEPRSGLLHGVPKVEAPLQTYVVTASWLPEEEEDVVELETELTFEVIEAPEGIAYPQTQIVLNAAPRRPLGSLPPLHIHSDGQQRPQDTSGEMDRPWCAVQFPPPLFHATRALGRASEDGADR